jgi:hypothetical protein
MSYDYGFRKGEKKGESLFFPDDRGGGAKTKNPKAKKKARKENNTEGDKLKGASFRNLRFFAA